MRPPGSGARRAPTAAQRHVPDLCLHARGRSMEEQLETTSWPRARRLTTFPPACAAAGPWTCRPWGARSPRSSGAGRASPLCEPGVRYADYALWQREQLAGERLHAQLDRWRERLRGASPTAPLPDRRAAAPGLVRPGARVEVEIPRQLSRAVGELGRAAPRERRPSSARCSSSTPPRPSPTSSRG